MTIKIKTDKDGKVKKIKSDIPVDLARFSIERVSGKPGRYRIKRTYRSRLVVCVKAFICRIGYVIAQTAAAFRVACVTSGTAEDVPRHQRG